MYHAVLYLHVLSAIVAVGSNATYAVWFARGAIAREHLLFALRGVAFIDGRVANPAYVLLLLTGAAMVVMSGRPWNEPWIVAALVLYALLAIVGIAFYTPALKREIAAVERGGPDDPGYAPAAARQNAVAALLLLFALVILYLMVFRPGGA
jgi:uncharacterized membrane protein